jgi:hypothetical protein
MSLSKHASAGAEGATSGNFRCLLYIEVLLYDEPDIFHYYSSSVQSLTSETIKMHMEK